MTQRFSAHCSHSCIYMFSYKQFDIFYCKVDHDDHENVLLKWEDIDGGFAVLSFSRALQAFVRFPVAKDSIPGLSRKELDEIGIRTHLTIMARVLNA